jgi:hypothetical protein
MGMMNLAVLEPFASRHRPPHTTRVRQNRPNPPSHHFARPVPPLLRCSCARTHTPTPNPRGRGPAVRKSPGWGDLLGRGATGPVRAAGRLPSAPRRRPSIRAAPRRAAPLRGPRAAFSPGPDQATRPEVLSRCCGAGNPRLPGARLPGSRRRAGGGGGCRAPPVCGGPAAPRRRLAALVGRGGGLRASCGRELALRGRDWRPRPAAPARRGGTCAAGHSRSCHDRPDRTHGGRSAAGRRRSGAHSVPFPSFQAAARRAPPPPPPLARGAGTDPQHGGVCGSGGLRACQAAPGRASAGGWAFGRASAGRASAGGWAFGPASAGDSMGGPARRPLAGADAAMLR